MHFTGQASYVLHKLKVRGIGHLIRRAFQKETGVPLFNFTIHSPNIKYGIEYKPSPAGAVKTAIESLQLEYSDYTFIDIGCGKGAVLKVASFYPFHKIVGVEFAKELANAAMRECPFAEVAWMDAADFSYPEGSLLIYMYNPFEPPLMEQVMKRIAEAAAARNIYIIYLQPVCLSIVEHYCKALTPIQSCMTFKVL